MPTFKRAQKLFKSQYRIKTVHNELSISSPATRSSSTPGPATAQQSPQTQGIGSSSARSSKTLDFLSLPGEVRNLIYASAIFPSLKSIAIFHHADTFLVLPIFHVSRQVRNEAVSYLCAENSIYLSSLDVANDFFRIVGENGLRSLRRVTVRCADTWRSESTEASAKKDAFLGYLKLAMNLRCFQLVVGRFPLSREDEAHLGSAHSSGAEFLHAARNVVDGIEVNETETAPEGRSDEVHEQVGEGKGIECLKVESRNDGTPRNVFQLCKANGVVGEVNPLELPSRLPAFLQLAEDEHTEAS
ncbi:hypothetical protein M3J09_011602 [Ascochyta lentis]